MYACLVAGRQPRSLINAKCEAQQAVIKWTLTSISTSCSTAPVSSDDRREGLGDTSPYFISGNKFNVLPKWPLDVQFGVRVNPFLRVHTCPGESQFLPWEDRKKTRLACGRWLGSDPPGLASVARLVPSPSAFITEKIIAVPQSVVSQKTLFLLDTYITVAQPSFTPHILTNANTRETWKVV